MLADSIAHPKSLLLEKAEAIKLSRALRAE